MRGIRGFFLLAAALPALWLHAAPAPGQELLPAGGEPVIIHALSLERNAEEGVVVGEGAVDIRHGDLRLRADKVVLNEKTSLAIAEGNVILEEGESILQGEHMEVDLEERTGFVEGGHGFAQSYFFTGRRIEKSGPAEYRVLEGSFTTCEGALPDWKFKSPDTLFEVDRRVTTRHPSMWVRRLPVLYLPYATFPLKRERATGLLIPEVRINEIDGWTVKNAFYWAPRDNFDATLSLDWRQNVGWGPGLELRYITAPGTYGTFDGSYVNDKEGEDSWLVTFNHLHDLPYRIRGQADLFFQSNYVKRFEDTLEMQSMEKTASSVYFSRSWASYDVVLGGLYEESLVTENDSSIARFPELSVDRTQGRLLGTGLFWRLAVEAVRRESKDGVDVLTVPGDEGEEEDDVLLADEVVVETNRIDLYPELSWPLTLGGWGSLTPTFAYRVTHYSQDLDGDSDTRLIPFFDLAAEGPRLYRIFDPSGDAGGLDKIKHLIEPRVSYVYVPEEEQDNLPQFDSIDFVGSRNNLVYSLTNTLLGRLTPTMAGERARTRELLRVRLSQSYDFDAEEQPFSNMAWDVVGRPSQAWDLWWRGDYDFYESEIGSQSVSANWRSRRGMTLRGEWRSSNRGGSEFLDLWAKVPLGNWFWDLRSRYNIDQDEFIENSVSIKYTSQCWDVTAGYVNWPDENEVRFELGLKGIGNVISLWSRDAF